MRGWFTAMLASPNAIAAASVLTVAMCWRAELSDWRRLRPLALTLGAGLVARLTSLMIRRPGPGHLGDLAAANVASFPSVSAAMATCLACTIFQALPSARRRNPIVVAGVLFIAAVPLVARLAPGRVWPLDELAGVLVGVAIARIDRPRRHHRWRMPRHPGRVAVAACALGAVMLIPVGWSYSRILTAPGSARLNERTIEWLRDNGMSPLVDRAESYWLWRHLPSPIATIATLPPAPVELATSSASGRLPSSIAGPIRPALPGEGKWSLAAVDARGEPQIATTFFRPDRSHPSLVAAVAWINATTTKVTLIAGTRQPGGGAGPAGGRVPAAARGTLLAAFNTGYKMKDTPGGTLIEGRRTRAMVDGLATLAVRPDGTATIGEWGTDLTADQGFVGLRQNLHLMIANGQIVDGVASNAGGRWGTVHNALPTWRSGLGVTAAGDLVYVAGNDLTLGVLADALLASGAVNAMELDIHNQMVTFNLFTHDPDLVGHKLLPNMPRPANRYLTTDWRDFVMVTSR
jgi:hypothetical protein